jgi:glycosyltransferase involved in cell wall biosynthesis
MAGHHIVQVMQYFALGGLERMVVALSRGLIQRGWEVSVAAYLGDGPLRAELEEAGARAVLLQGQGKRAITQAIDQWSVAQGASLLHTHHVGPFIHAAPVALLRGLPLLHTEHSHELYTTPRLRVVGRLMQHAAQVSAVSAEIDTWRQRELGAAPCAVIPNGVAAPQRLAASAPRRDGRFVLGCVARLAPEKHHAMLLDAIALLPEARLVLVGDGPERGWIEAEIARRGLKERVEVLGARTDVDQLYRSFDAVALTSHREGLPLALLEAMAHGLPVVATAVGEVPALLADGAGQLVAPGDHRALAATIRAWQHDPWRRHRTAALGRMRVQERYSLEAMITAYEALYLQQLDGMRRAS